MKITFAGIAVTIVLTFYLTSPGSSYAQSNNALKLTGKISGLSDSTTIRISTTMGKRLAVPLVGGEFTANVGGFKEGEMISVTIDSIEGSVNILAENGVHIVLLGEREQWPECSFRGSKAQDEYLDFQEKIQKPFNRAYKAMVDGTKRNAEADSLMKKTYDLAASTYARDTRSWIARHPNALLTPQLIMNWSPQADRRSLYEKMEERTKNSFFGEELGKQIALPGN